ncbi:MAG: WD40/YVTN/BNR-like repeat-containing protein [Acidobacteriaceae bacterium]
MTKEPVRLSSPFRLSLFLLCVLFTVPSHAVNWFAVGPGGGDARSFAADPHDPNHLYMGTTTGWIYESHDDGASWQHLARLARRNDLVIDNIVIDSSNPNHILAGAWVVDHSDGGVFVSEDGGHTWISHPELQGQSIRALAQAPSDPKVFVAGALSGVYRSQDGGQHWVQISPRGSREIHEIESIAIDPRNPQIIYAGTWHLPWKTMDGGAHWHNIKQGVIDDSDVFSIIVDPRSPQTVYASACSGIYKSEDAGDFFHKVQGIPSTARRTRVLAQDPKNADIVFAGTTEGLFRTSDAGKTWLRTTSPEVIVNDVYVNPANTNDVLLATDRGGVLASNDGGFTFQSSNRGFSSRQIVAYASEQYKPANLYIGVINDKQTGGVFASDNGGITWSQRSLGLDGRDIFSLIESPDDTLLAGTNQGLFRWTSDGWVPSGKVERSVKFVRTAARSRRKISSPGTELEGGVYALAHGGDILYASTSDGILISMTGGMSWKKLNLQGTVAGDSDMRYLCASGAAVFAADTRQMAFSADHGENWKKLLLPPRLSGIAAIAIDDTGELWVGGREGIFYSLDHGSSWFTVPNFPLSNINSLYYDAAGKRILLTAGVTSTMAYAVDIANKHITLWDSGWHLRFVRPVGDHLIASTLFDGMVLQPRMVASPIQIDITAKK